MDEKWKLSKKETGSSKSLFSRSSSTKGSSSNSPLLIRSMSSKTSSTSKCNLSRSYSQKNSSIVCNYNLSKLEFFLIRHLSYSS
ncbi:hypothetical protein Lal_00034780 [Lupinus albus]|nr:hypothetical protein Lal_00034780 [Lupinus albus]